jgi:hypothetical protein
MKLNFIVLVLSFSMIGFAQNRSCGMNQLMEKKLSNSEYAAAYKARQSEFNARLSQASFRTDQSTLIIPVAVHFPGGVNTNRACLIALAQNQIAILNNDYNATNADAASWTQASAFYPGVNLGNVNVKFVIATFNHPANTDPNLVEGQPAVTVGYDFGSGSADGDSDMKWRGYMNFIVKDIGERLLGYSPLGGSFLNGEGVVMSPKAFGSESGCEGFAPKEPYNLGRTVTHELGHFFNLDHTFGDEKGCVSSNTDHIDDTPKVGKATYGTPGPGTIAGCVAPQKALTMSYMDYVNDSSMYMFSAGQAARARAYMLSVQNDFKANVFTKLAVAADKMKTSFGVFPNPSEGDFKVEFNPNYNDVVVISVCDLAGRKVFENKYDASVSSFSQNIRLLNIIPGIYLLTVKNGGSSEVRKIVVE